jgi:glycyl-tRNA synthetase beta subunit
MFKKIKNWLHTFKLLHIDSGVEAISKASVTQEDPTAIAAVKRVRNIFKENINDINTKALKPHDAKCKDPLMCAKNKCFKWSADKIASKEYVVEDEKAVTVRTKRNMRIVRSMNKDK